MEEVELNVDEINTRYEESEGAGLLNEYGYEHLYTTDEFYPITDYEEIYNNLYQTDQLIELGVDYEDTVMLFFTEQNYNYEMSEFSEDRVIRDVFLVVEVLAIVIMIILILRKRNEKNNNIKV